MALRKKPRIKMVAPIRIWGMDSAGKPFNILSYTLNVSSSGARIGGVKVPLAVGDAVTLQYKKNKALFKVVWVGRPADPTQEQIGVTLLEQDRPIWGEIEDPTNFTDDFRGTRAIKPEEAPPVAPAAAADPSTPNAEVPAAAETIPVVPDVLPSLPQDDTAVDTNGLLHACAESLLKIDGFVRNHPPDAGPLHEFRNALARVRQTVWALQQWHEVKAEGKTAFPLLSYLNAERVQFLNQAAKDLTDDVELKGVEVESSHLQTLFTQIDRLRSITSASFKFEMVAPATADTAGENRVSAIQMALMSVMTDALRSGMSERDSMSFFSRELHRTMQADGVAVAKFDRGEMVCVGTSGNAPDPGMVLETETGIGAEAVRSGQIVYCHDTQQDVRVDAELCRAANIGAVVMVPVVSSSSVPLGMVQVCTARKDPFNEEHLAALRTAANLLRDVIAANKPAVAG